VERSAAASYLLCAEGPPFFAIGPMDKNAQLHWTFRWPSLPSLQQLRFLCALVEQCHFGRAAESCDVTQSTLSGGIKELEARLGITLFERGHRHVMLTPLGKEIATRAQRLTPATETESLPEQAPPGEKQ
jgi:hypothetical protein